MSFEWLPAPAFFAGLAAIAAGLFALQRLRVRHRTVLVPTTQFWREATEHTRARVLVQRFRHPLAYLLVLAIATLAWLAVAGPRDTVGVARQRVLVLDASACMAIGTRFADALSALEHRAAALPRGTTRVVVAGAHARTLLDAGEDLPLFERRARDLAPEACPSTLARALEDACAARPAGSALDVEVFGDSALDPHLLELLGRDVRVCRAPPAAARVPNAGIVALGVSEAQSGAWTRVDILVAASASAVANVRVHRSGTELPVDWDTAREPGLVTGVVRDVESDGGRIDASIADGGALALDDHAALVLPVRRALRVALSPTVPPVVAAALRSDPGVVLAEDAADVVVRGNGEPFGGGAPALVLSSETDQEAAFVVHHPRTLEPERTLRAAFDEIGLDEIDATEMARQARRPITLALVEAPARGITMWSTLLAPPYDFTGTRSFPLFLARAVRWLADAAPLEATCAAGAWHRGVPRPWTDARGFRIDTLGAEARYPRAGELLTLGGAPLGVALLDRDTTSLRADVTALPDTDAATPAGTSDPRVWIGLALLALLLCEWWLVRTERIP